MKLIKEEIRELLDPSSLILAGFALLGGFLSISMKGTYTRPISLFMKGEGLLFLCILVATELGKESIIADKRSKRMEFYLANGVSLNKIVAHYTGVLYLGSLLLILPTLGIYFYGFFLNKALGDFFCLLLCLLTTGFLACLWLVYSVLHTENLNRLNKIQWKALVLALGLMGVSIVFYHTRPMVELYLGSKFGCLVLAILFLKHTTTKEGIVRSYY